MPDDYLTLGEARSRLGRVREALAEAAVRSGRQPEAVRLLAVSKTFPGAMIRTYLEAGQADFGESYIQEARDKAAGLAANQPAPAWHFIGHLQTNKAKYAAPLFDVIHSLDSLELAEALHRRASALGRTIQVYAQVNVSGEDSKSGMSPAALPAFLEGLAAFPALIPQGLMTMPPYDPDPELSRPHFAALRELRDRCAPHLPGLSMGMSGDFAVAVEEGATIVRVGTALFGPRG
ncbi:MAG: YggS family pyridoxal phosphate-dependent enzyme [Candidatus Adiutrix sp.]|jgi:pyridoxal phosphate enzyme (YggS family)|nr:YggS family pyridoxal phosphate-dependent enzyme [Candidatus Adiutrix sp.]